MESETRLLRWFMAILFIPVILFLPLFAFAGGTDHEAPGFEAFLAGALPPPGFYVKEYLLYYTADKLKDDSGHTLSLARNGMELDRLSVYGSITRFLYISPLKVLDAFLGADIIFPVVSPRMKLDVLTPGGPAELSDRHTMLGDIVFGPNLSWHHKSGLLHGAVAFHVAAPTGLYNKRNLINIGTNCWSFSPILAVTGFLPWHPSLGASIKMDYTFNTRNNDFLASGVKTHLRPGQDFHFDFSIDYGLSKAGAPHQFRVGVVGYFYQQTTDDDTGLGKVKDNKGRVFAIGPGIFWSYKKWVVEAHVGFEMAVENRPQGVNTILSIVHAF